MRVKNVLISFVMFGLVGYGGLKLWVFYKAKENFQQILYCAGMPRMPNSAPQSDFFEYDRISASVFGPIGIKGLKIRIPQMEEEISFGEVQLTFEHDGDIKTCPTPTHIKFSITDMRMNVSLLEKIEKQQEKMRRRGYADPDSVPEVIRRLGYSEIYERADDFRALGYDQIVANVSLDMWFNPEDKEATFEVRQSMKDLGELQMMIKVADMSKNLDSAVLGIKIKEARIEFTDDSYIERLLKIFADEDNDKVEDLRARIVAGLEDEITLKQIKLSKDAINSLKAFLKKPEKLTITMYPFKPIGVESIKHYKPGDVPMLLNLQIYSE